KAYRHLEDIRQDGRTTPRRAAIQGGCPRRIVAELAPQRPTRHAATLRRGQAEWQRHLLEPGRKKDGRGLLRQRTARRSIAPMDGRRASCRTNLQGGRTGFLQNQREVATLPPPRVIASCLCRSTALARSALAPPFLSPRYGY